MPGDRQSVQWSDAQAGYIISYDVPDMYKIDPRQGNNDAEGFYEDDVYYRVTSWYRSRTHCHLARHRHLEAVRTDPMTNAVVCWVFFTGGTVPLAGNDQAD